MKVKKINLTQPLLFSLDKRYDFEYNRNRKDQLLAASIYNSNESFENGYCCGRKTISFSYDYAGYPFTYCSESMNWSKNRLANYKGVTFEYDASGKRTKKNNTPYVYVGDQLYKEGSMRYFYGSDGVAGFLFGSTRYYYQKNAQGDVIAILTCDGSGNNSVKATYVYDAFGNHKVYDANGNENFDEYFIGNINPIRYRSYYYDIETGLYYLQARYYDPKIGRFISPDNTKYLEPTTIGGLNLYAYCNNNPVNKYDPTGNFAITTLIWIIVGAAVLTTAGTITYGAVTETPVVMDFSISGGMGAGVGGKIGLSIVLDFKNDSIGFYPHYGYYYSMKYNTFVFSYGVGLISNYENEGDYAGPFVSLGGGFYGGLDHCYDPRYFYDETVRASSITFGNNKGVYYGYDYYDYWGSIPFLW